MRRNLVILISLVVVASAIALGWFFLTDNAELSGDIQENAEQLETGSGVEQVFRIDPERSQVEFNIDEVLRGEDVTVVGVTRQVAGDIRINPSNPSASEIGTIIINARDLTTDADGRNRALRQFILKSSEAEFEFIEFTPKTLNNMPESVTIGEPFTFEIVGDLSVIGTTQEVTFTAEITPVSETEITGNAEAVVLYQDFGITIPSVPFVASVEDTVTLKINFTAAESNTETAG